MGVFEGFSSDELDLSGRFIRGKVRDILDYGSHLVITTTDRISAFDRVLGVVPEKGEILHQLSVFWFQQTQHLLPNALVGTIGPRTALMRKAKPLPVEIIVRGYLTGSVLRDYEKAMHIWGLPSGLTPHQQLPHPFVTPTTKAYEGHDEPISKNEIIKRGLVEGDVWEQVELKAVALFEYAQNLLNKNGLLLVDTKYEMGLLDGQLVLIDEVHTPDSSRFWYANTYLQDRKDGVQPRQLDKEVLRSWLLAQNWMGDGDPPTIPQQVFDEVRSRYLEAWQSTTAQDFVPSPWNRQTLVQEITRWLPKN